MVQTPLCYASFGTDKSTHYSKEEWHIHQLSMTMWNGQQHLAWYTKDGYIISQHHLIMYFEGKMDGGRLTLTYPLKLQRNPDRNVTSVHSYIKEYTFVYVAQRVVGTNWSLFEGGFRSTMTQTPIRFHLECTSHSSIDQSTHNVLCWYRKTFYLIKKGIFKYKSVFYIVW